VKRLAGLRELSDEHHTGLVLARRCKQAARDAADRSLRRDWNELRVELERQLDPHFAIEERILLPALEALEEGALASRIREEHQALRELRASDPTRESLARLGALLEAHIRFEEREVFERTQSRLPEAVREAIAEACRRARRPGSRLESAPS
jgi:hemerythrin-like domain-containing protein